MDTLIDLDKLTYDVAREAKDALQSLVDSPGWKKYISIVEEQVAVRTNKIILQPLLTHDAVLEQEFSKGEVAALRTVASLPETVLKELTDWLIRQRKAEGEEE